MSTVRHPGIVTAAERPLEAPALCYRCAHGDASGHDRYGQLGASLDGSCQWCACDWRPTSHQIIETRRQRRGDFWGQTILVCRCGWSGPESALPAHLGQALAEQILSELTRSLST